MSRSAKLYALQQTDSEIGARRERLVEMKVLLGETEDLTAARQRLDAAKQTLRELNGRHRDLELAIQGLEEKRRDSERELYGGKIRNPKELADLEEEVASLSRRKAKEEDGLLEVMLRIEEAEAEQAEASRHWRRIEGEWSSEQARLEAEIALQEDRLAELTEQRQQQASLVPAADLDAYEYLLPRRGGVAVVLLKDGECQGCMTTVSAAKAREARSNDALAACGTCRRLLHPA